MRKVHPLRADLGYKFTEECRRLVEAKALSNDDVRATRETIMNFLIELVEQLQVRLSKAELTFSAYSKMSPRAFLQRPPKLADLPFK